MTGRAKLSKIIHVKPFQLSDEKNKENLDISKPIQHTPQDATLLDTKLPSSLTNSIEDVYVGSPRPSLRKPTPSPSSNRRSRSLDRLTASGTSSDRRNSYFDIRNHTHSLGSQQELAPVFTTTYRTVFSTLTTNTPTTAMNGANSYSNSSKNSLSNASIGSRFKTAEFTFQKSPVKRRAKW
ncbi:hypothetical protein E2C01_084263 [Portunus trituberculatus]|uniref:Uncharacterized protein n=2 Tax=Portunus trituberculatus TaxID=210409 RepID=A0A5B7J4C6_PORTR|nr:hypothetical protein [Portunus trituberculatus]